MHVWIADAVFVSTYCLLHLLLLMLLPHTQCSNSQQLLCHAIIESDELQFAHLAWLIACNSVQTVALRNWFGLSDCGCYRPRLKPMSSTRV